MLKKGLSDEEISSKIKDITSSLGGYVTDQAALYLLAKEYKLDFLVTESDSDLNSDVEDTIDYDDFLVKISDITPETSNIVLIGKVLQNFGCKTFTRKDGTSGKVGSFLLQDDSGAIKVVLWDNNANIVQSEAFQEEITIRVIGGHSKINIYNNLEVNLNSRGKIEFIEDRENSNSNFNLKIKNIKKLNDISLSSISGEVVDAIELKEISTKTGKKTFLFKFRLFDGEDSIYVSVWHLKAIELYKVIKKGDNLTLNNAFIKINKFTNSKELVFSEKSSFVKN